MQVTFHIPGPLLSLTHGQRFVQVEIAPGRLRDAMEVLFDRYPGLRDRILTEQGAVREHVNVFLGKEDIRYLEGLDTAVPHPVEISIIPAVSGG
jgi:molybdopterin synthase sulfur carrier subunit